MPDVAGVAIGAADRVVQTDTHRGREVAHTENQAFQPPTRGGNLFNGLHSFHFFDQRFDANSPRQLVFVLEHRQQLIEELNVGCTLHLGHHQGIYILASAGDDLDHVVVRILRREVIDSNTSGLLAPVQLVECVHNVAASGCLLIGGDRIFQVEEA